MLAEQTGTLSCSAPTLTSIWPKHSLRQVNRRGPRADREARKLYGVVTAAVGIARGTALAGERLSQPVAARGRERCPTLNL
jgi:hypothetical protein